jgi:hypothetical protein
MSYYDVKYVSRELMWQHTYVTRLINLQAHIVEINQK